MVNSNSQIEWYALLAMVCSIVLFWCHQPNHDNRFWSYDLTSWSAILISRFWSAPTLFLSIICCLILGFLGSAKATSSNVSSPITHALDSNSSTEWTSPGVSRDSTAQELNITLSFGQVSREGGTAILDDKGRSHYACVLDCHWAVFMLKNQGSVGLQSKRFTVLGSPQLSQHFLS